MLFGDDRFAKDGGGDGNARLFRELEQVILQAKAVHLDVGEDHRLLCVIEQRGGFRKGFGQGVRVAGFVQIAGAVVGAAGGGDEIARQFEIDRPLVAHRRVEHAIDLGESGVGIFERGAGHGDLVEDALLRIEVAHLVVEQGILVALVQARRAADHHHRRFFRKGAGDRIHHFQAAHAVSDADHAEPIHPRIAIRREPRALLVAGHDRLHVALQKLVVKAEHVIAGNAEHMPHTVRLQLPDEILANAGGSIHKATLPHRLS